MFKQVFWATEFRWKHGHQRSQVGMGWGGGGGVSGLSKEWHLNWDLEWETKKVGWKNPSR